tara:strand:- start:1315 stop:1488 length:174 start_codon:yes stop_codon:yes gene_type:complete
MKTLKIVECIKTQRMGVIIDDTNYCSSWGEKHLKIQWYDGKLEVYPEKWIRRLNENR